MTHTQRRRTGFTLLEMLLALLIAALVMVAVGFAINLHMQMLDGGRSEVETAQLARTLLRQMADDVRGTVRYQAVDTSLFPTPTKSNASSKSSSSGSTSSGSSTGGGGSSSGGSQSSGSSSGSTSAKSAGSASSASSAGGSSGKQSSGSSGGGSSGGSSGSSSGGGSSGGSSSQSSGSSTQSSSGGSSSSSTDATTTTVLPGLYGSEYELKIDRSHLPRATLFNLDQANATMARDAVSDLKTVSYYVVDPLTGGSTGGGLVRREYDRAASQFSTTQGGGGEDLAMFAQVLAPEVLAVAFRYYDGTTWVTEWDSTTSSNIPVAVEIALTLGAPTTASSNAIVVNGRLVEPVTFRQVVALQVAEAATDTTSTTSSSSTSGTSSSGTSNTSSAGS